MLTPAAIQQLRDRVNTKWHKNALNCVKCPKEGCPLWQTLHLQDPVQGAQDITGCGFVLQQAYLGMAIGASMGAIQATEQQTQQIVGAVQQVAQIEAQRELKVLNGV